MTIEAFGKEPGAQGGAEQLSSIAVKKADKKRTLLMLSGGLLIVPWFFLDLSDADKIEANAQRARYNYLVDRGVKRNCRLKIPQIKKFYFDDKGYKKKRNR